MGLGNSIKFHSNGFIVKWVNSEYANKFRCPNASFNYYGIEGDNWPIDRYTEGISEEELNYIENYLWENIESRVDDINFVWVCNDIIFIKRYVDVCKKANMKIEILFCESERSFPGYVVKFHEPINLQFIGYDYAYASADYYSCVFNEIPRTNEMQGIKLNQFGLFSTENEILEFVNLRNKLITTNPLDGFEKGDFIIYKLWRYNGEF